MEDKLLTGVLILLALFMLALTLKSQRHLCSKKPKPGKPGFFMLFHIPYHNFPVFHLI